MSKVFIEESTLTSIGDAIRGKNGTTDLIAPLDMAAAISNLSSGAEVKHAQIYAGSASSSRRSIDLSEYNITDINQIIFMAWPNYYNASNNYGGFSIFSPLIGSKVIGRTSSAQNAFSDLASPLGSSKLVGGTPVVENGVFSIPETGYMNCIMGNVELIYI